MLSSHCQRYVDGFGMTLLIHIGGFGITMLICIDGVRMTLLSFIDEVEMILVQVGRWCWNNAAHMRK